MAVEADGAVADDGVADAMVGTGATVHHQNLFPLSRYVLIISLQAVALDDNGLVSCAINDELAVAPREDAAALVTVDLGSSFDFQGAVAIDECIAIDDVGPFRSPNRGLKAIGDDMIRIGHSANVHNLVGNDVVGILSPG